MAITNISAFQTGVNHWDNWDRICVRDNNFIYYHIINKQTGERRLHNEHGPAFRWHTTDNNAVIELRYYIHGRLHNENGPAIIEYRLNGNLKTEKYYRNGILHREKGPASIEYGVNNHPLEMTYIVNGKINKVIQVDLGVEISTTMKYK